MAILNINCTCTYKFKLDMHTGLFTCPKCKKLFLRYFDHKIDDYKIIIGNQLKEKNDKK